MKVLIPMSGLGSRFKNAGYKKIKPLICVDGFPIIEHIVNLFSKEDELIFICNKEHFLDKKIGLEKILKGISPFSKIVVIESHKAGPNYAIMGAKEFLNEEPVFVCYCDFNIFWNQKIFLDEVKKSHAASASVCYKGFHPHLLGQNFYAGVKGNKDNFALEVREKFSFTPNKMDTWQQAGLFWFSSGNLLKKYCEKTLTNGPKINGESYTSFLFNPMLADGYKSFIFPVEYFCQWGTPEDLEEYEAWSRLFANKEKIKKGKTDIPKAREKNIKVKEVNNSEQYKKSYEYWERYFSLCFHHPLNKKNKND